MIRNFLFLMLCLLSTVFSSEYPANSGIILTDSDGKTYDIDSIISSGTLFVTQQTTIG